MQDITFEAWPKTPRLFRGMTITEKIDGTNAAVIITDDGRVAAQSRNRLITPEQDNYGFAAWAERNADELVELLGPGRHFGEWWGSGIQRGYGRVNGHRTFSLFNVKRYGRLFDGLLDIGLNTVPVLYEGEEFGTQIVRNVLADLKSRGSRAYHGFMNPEGVIVYLHASGTVHKVTFEHDDKPKGMVA